jgi:hypothetical protein
MSKAKLSCIQEWRKRKRMLAEADRLKAEGNKLYAEGRKLWAEGNKLRAEGDKLWAEGDKLRADADPLFIQAVVKQFGKDVQYKWIEWADGCRTFHVGQEVYT